MELVCPPFVTKVEDLRSRREKRNEENEVGNRKLAWEGCPLVLTSIQSRNKLCHICYPTLSCLVLSQYPR